MPVQTPMDWEASAEDIDMDWDDAPSLPWSDIIKIEESRNRARRRRRAAKQKKVFLHKMEEKLREKELMMSVVADWLIDESWKEWTSEVIHQLATSPGITWTITTNPNLEPILFHETGVIKSSKRTLLGMDSGS